MASNAAIHRVELNIADMDRHYYADHTLTIARHPSETEERMMVRLLAYALWSHERLEFGRGIATLEDADLWQRDLTGRIERWIDVGLPDARRIKQALGQSDEVAVLAFGGRAVDLWWKDVVGELPKGRALSVLEVMPETTEAMAGLCQRTMSVQFMVQEGERWLALGDERFVVPLRWRLGEGATA